MKYSVSSQAIQEPSVQLMSADQILIDACEINEAYELLAEDNRRLADALNVLGNIETAVRVINKFGVNDEVIDILGAEDLSIALDGNVRDMSEYMVMEGLGSAINDAWKKFVEMIKKFAGRVKEFFQKLFNTTTNKAKTILEAIKNKQMDYDKEVNVITSAEATELTGAADALSAFASKYATKSWSSITWLTSIRTDIKALAGKYSKFLEASEDGTSVKFKDDAIKPENKALKAAGYGDSNAAAICNAFMSSSTSTSRISDSLVKIANSVSSVTMRAADKAMDKTSSVMGVKNEAGGSDARQDIKSAYSVLSAAHNAQMKCQRMRAAVISALYSGVKEKGTETPTVEGE